YIAQQTGVEHFQVDTGPGPSLAADPHPIISTGINVNVTDVVDTPEHIYAHMGMSVGGVTPGVVDVPTPDVLQADAPPDVTTAESPVVASDINLYPDRGDQPEVIAANAAAATSTPTDDRLLAQARPEPTEEDRMREQYIDSETQVRIGPSQA